MLTKIEGYRISPQQRRIWQLRQESQHEPFLARTMILVEGELDRSLLKQALYEVASRHEILRTTFHLMPGLTVPVQVIEDNLHLQWEEQELTGASLENQKEYLEQLFIKISEHSFDLDKGPSFHTILAKIAPNKHVLLVALPAMRIDNAIQPFLNELAQAYAELTGFAVERDVEEEEAIPYVALSNWLNELLEAEEGKEGRDYWGTQELATALDVHLPFAEPKKEDSVFSPRTLTWEMNAEVAHAISKLAEAEEAEVSDVLLAAWQALLVRLTGELAVVGVACDGRSDEELASAIGLLARYVPLTCKFDRNDSFRSVLSLVKRSDEENREWQESFAWETLQSGSDIPYFTFGYDFTDLTPQHRGVGLELTVLRQAVCFDRFDLRLSGVKRAERLAVEFHYDANVLSEADLERVSGYFERLVTHVTAEPTDPIGRADLVGAEEREQLLVALNQTDVAFSTDQALHQLFEEQAEKSPDRIAVVFGEQKLTYAELNSRANHLARDLQASGVADGSIVAIACERSLEMIVGMLAVLKAGGAYLPVDVDYPEERILYMVQDSSAKILLTQQHLKERFGGQKVQVILLDEQERANFAEEKWDNLDLPIIAEQPAYLIYTSGSSGQPKGVVIGHRAIFNHMQWMQAEFPLDHTDRVLQKTAFSFDASVWEFYAPLIAGAQLVFAKPYAHLDSATLVQEIQSHGVTTLQVVPTMLNMLLEQEKFASCTSLTRVYAGGEQLTRELQQRFHRIMPNVDLVNLYGPTECCIDSTYWVAEYEGTGHAVPIGRPIANAKVYVLDEYLQPVPLGVAGELYIGGAGLAIGYLHRPELTAERFLPNPFAEGKRLYKTGDLVRSLPGGVLEFLGRSDDQVKLRGFRIELGEIEAVLNRHESVQQAVVLMRKDKPGDQLLVAYLVCNEKQPKLQDLRFFLNGQLPEYMTPSAYVFLDALPLTPNGKVDRRQLPEPDLSAEGYGFDYVAPRNSMEELIAGIWSQVLGIGKIGVYDHFFERGGHSLLATQVIARLRDVFQVSLPLRKLFTAPTVEMLAKEVLAAQRQGNVRDIPAIQPVSREGILPLSFAQQRLWFLEQMEPNSPLYNMIDAIRLRGVLNADALKRSLNEIVRRHESLRTIFQDDLGRPKQLIVPQVTLEVPMVELTQYPVQKREEQAMRLIKAESQLPFDLAVGPLVRAQVLRLDEQEHILILTTHHIVNDGWSRGVIVEELGNLYQAFLKNEPTPLSELPIQYADFAVWQREWMQGDVFEEQLAYWKKQLGGSLPMLQLPTDHSRPAKPTFKGSLHQVTLPQDLTSKLHQLSQQEGVTLFMTLLAGFKVLLSRYTAQEDVVVGSAIANRNHGEIANLIGFFVNTLGLRTDLSGDPTIRELLARVREVSLGAYAHQDLPFEKLVEELQPERDTSHSPLFRVMFTLQNLPMSALELPNLTLKPILVDNETSKFDITLSITEGPDGLIEDWEYNSDLFEAGTIGRMADQYATLLEHIVHDPNQQISKLPLVAEREQKDLAMQANDTATDYPKHLCLHELFAEQVEKSPNAVAVVFGEQSLTYRELNRRTNQVAHQLQALGVGPRTMVGVGMERSLELVIAILGIVKAGAAYVPIDPAYPTGRLSFMLEDANVQIMLTQARFVEKWDGYVGQTLCLDTEWNVFAVQSEQNPQTNVTPEDLAYMIYTSGSTGQPKGVCVPQRGVIRLVKGTDYVHFGPEETFLQFAPVSFDAATFEIWGALLNGARLVVFPAHRASLEELGDVLLHHGVTTMFMTTALFNQMADNHLDSLSVLRYLLVGGEAMSVSHIQKALNALGNCRIANIYGPTENTTFSTYYPLTESARFVPSVPIGRPIANTTVYVLDSERRIVPVGVPGELYIGGDGVALGYWNRPEMTEERFVADLFRNDPKARLYRTGDLVRRLQDGNLEFLGRVDDQVKIRGFRIELGEVESALREHQSVRDAVVIAREDEPGDKRLVAYVVSQASAIEMVEGDTEQQREQVEQWEMIFDDYFYSQEAANQDETFNTIGWNSNFTGQPIPQNQMRLWLENTIAQILRLNPTRVLEIGCGTGMLLYRIAKQSESYWGFDISKGVLSALQQQLASRQGEFDHVQLFHRPAHDFDGIENGAFNTVILNSVVQYFPSGDYLTDVLTGAVQAVEKGGAIFIGDVRSLPLQETFHTAVELFKADDELPVEQLVQRAQKRLQQDNELVISPGYFHMLKRKLPQITAVSVMLKQGHYQNELSQFRYDVVLHVGQGIEYVYPQSYFDWQSDRMTLEALHEHLTEMQPESVSLQNVPNARVYQEVTMMQLLKGADLPQTVGQLRHHLAALPQTNAVDPADLFSWGDRLGYRVEICSAHSEADGTFDVLLIKKTEDAKIDQRQVVWPCRGEQTELPSHLCTSQPMKVQSPQKLIPLLRRSLEEKLPEYMVPTEFVMLEDLPLTPNGKVDKRALPKPDKIRLDLVEYIAPRNEIEELVADVWKEILGFETIGVFDNFFEMGGHSLLATQVISRLREDLQLNLSLHKIFEAPTVAGFAELVESMLMEELEELSEEEAQKLLEAGVEE